MTPTDCIRNACPGVLDIFCYGDIGTSWGATAVDSADIVRQIEGSNARQINVYINSSGGAAAEGIAIYNALRRHRAHKVTYNDGFALSIASLIFQAGDERVMGQGAFLMLHDPFAVAVGTADELKSAAGVLELVADNLVNIYVSRSGRTAADVRRIMSAETWFGPDEAIAEGFADRTAVVQQRAVAGPLPNLSRFKHVPAGALRLVAAGGCLPVPPSGGPADFDFMQLARAHAAAHGVSVTESLRTLSSSHPREYALWVERQGAAAGERVLNRLHGRARLGPLPIGQQKGR